MVLHADAITQDRSSRIRAAGIDGDDAYRLIFSAVVLGKLIDEGALAGSGSSCKADDAGFAGIGEKRLQQVGPAGSTILNGGDRSGQSTWIAGAEFCDPFCVLGNGVQTASVKERGTN